MLNRRDTILLTCGILVGGAGMHLLYSSVPVEEVHHEFKTVQVERQSTQEAAKITVVKKVFVPGVTSSKDCQVATETTTVTEAPKRQTVSNSQKVEETLNVKQFQPPYRLGVSCTVVDCLDPYKLSFTGSVRLGESPFHGRATFAPQSLTTSIGLEIEF